MAGLASKSIQQNQDNERAINANPNGLTLRGIGATGMGPENKANQMPKRRDTIGPISDIRRCNDHPSPEASNLSGWLMIAIAINSNRPQPARRRPRSVAIAIPIPRGSKNIGSQ